MPKELQIDGVNYVSVKHFWTTPADIDDVIQVRVPSSLVGERPTFAEQTILLPMRPVLRQDIATPSMPLARLKNHQCSYGLAPLRKGYLYLLNATLNRLSKEKLIGNGYDDLHALEQSNMFKVNANEALYVAYSEVEWTARKEQQMLTSDTDRRTFMHPIRPDNRNSGYAAGAATVGDFKNCDPWLVSGVYQTIVGEKYQQLEERHGVGRVRIVVIPDDLGLLRDLSEQHESTQSAFQEWLEEDDRHTRYQVGAFIESLTAMENNELLELAQHKDFKHLMPDIVAHIKNTTSAEIEAARLQELNDLLAGKHPEPDYYQLEQGLLHEERAELRDNVHADWLVKYLPSFNEAFVRQHRHKFRRLQRAYNQVFSALLNGERMGSRGVNDVIKRVELQQFMEQYRQTLPTWLERLARINADRSQLITAHAFYRAAWYFDYADQAQQEHAEDAEYIAIQSITYNNSHEDALFSYTETHPLLMVPGAYHLPKNQQDELETLLRSFAVSRSLTAQDYTPVKEFFLEHLPHAATQLATDTRLMINEQYRSFIAQQQQKIAAEVLTKIKQQLATHSAESLFRMPMLSQVELIQALALERITLSEASPEQILRFHNNLEQLEQSRSQLTSLRNGIRQTATSIKQGSRAYAHEARERLASLKTRLKTTQSYINVLEQNILAGLLPVDMSEGAPAGRVGTQVHVSDTQINRSVSDIMREAAGNLAIGSYALANEAAFQRSLNALHLSKWDFLAGLLFFMQLRNVASAYHEYNEALQKQGVASRAHFDRALAAAGATGAALVQGVGAGLLIARHHHAGITLRVALGWLHLPLGFATYGLGFATALVGIGASQQRLARALEQGDRQATAAAAVSMAAQSGLAGLMGTGFAITSIDGVVVLKAMASGNQLAVRQAVASAGVRLSTLFVRLNLVGLAFSLIEITATYWYNRRTLTPLNEWLLQSAWGLQPSGAEQSQQLQLLQRLLYQPPEAQLIVTQGNARLELHLPNQSWHSLQQTGPVLLQVGYGSNLTTSRNDWDSWSWEFMASAELNRLQTTRRGLVLSYPIEAEQTNTYRIGYSLSVTEPMGGHDTPQTTHLEIIGIQARKKDRAEALKAVPVPRSDGKLTREDPIDLRQLRDFYG